MTSLRQIEANRRNATKNTAPVTNPGKERSRCNAVRHGLTTEIVIQFLEDAEDHKAFELSVTRRGKRWRACRRNRDTRRKGKPGWVSWPFPGF